MMELSGKLIQKCSRAGGLERPRGGSVPGRGESEGEGGVEVAPAFPTWVTG